MPNKNIIVSKSVKNFSNSINYSSENGSIKVTVNNSNNIIVSTQGLTNGIYITRITTEQGTKSVKLIKE